MNQKLQELTDRIYSQGVEQAQQEASRIEEEAQKAATAILEKATREAEKVRKQAERDAQASLQKAESEMKASVRQAMNSLKQQLTELVQVQLLDQPLKQAVADPDFRKQLLLKMLENWQPGTDSALRLLLPADAANLKKQLEHELQALLQQEQGLTIDLHEDVPGDGFRVQPKGEGYFVEFSEEAFQTFFRTHARPLIVNLLFAPENA